MVPLVSIFLALLAVKLLIICDVLVGITWIGPEHSFLKDLGRVELYIITDEEAFEGMENLIFIF
ncbi:putative tryptophan synthase [Helianthus annuus]|nr:putative tryptophan synthase [Helianthus annuus]